MITVTEILEMLDISIDNDIIEEITDSISLAIDDKLKEELKYTFDTIDDNGQIHERIDSNIDTYYADLWKWAGENWTYIDDAIDAGLCNPSNGIISYIQAGQYQQISEEVWEIISNIQSELESADYDSISAYNCFDCGEMLSKLEVKSQKDEGQTDLVCELCSIKRKGE